MKSLVLVINAKAGGFFCVENSTMRQISIDHTETSVIIIIGVVPTGHYIVPVVGRP